MAIDIRITNNSNGTQYEFRAVSTMRDSTTQPPIPIPITNTPPAATFLFRFVGQSQVMQFTFGYFNDGTDASNGNPGGVITLKAQELHLRNSIFTAEFDTDWTLEVFPDSADQESFTGVLTNLEFDLEAGKAPQVRTGNVSFQVGSLTGFF